MKDTWLIDSSNLPAIINKVLDTAVEAVCSDKRQTTCVPDWARKIVEDQAVEAINKQRAELCG